MEQTTLDKKYILLKILVGKKHYFILQNLLILFIKKNKQTLLEPLWYSDKIQIQNKLIFDILDEDGEYITFDDITNNINKKHWCTHPCYGPNKSPREHHCFHKQNVSLAYYLDNAKITVEFRGDPCAKIYG